VRFQELQRRGMVEFGIMGFIYDAYSAFAEFFEYFVMGYSSVNHCLSRKWLSKWCTKCYYKIIIVAIPCSGDLFCNKYKTVCLFMI